MIDLGSGKGTAYKACGKEDKNLMETLCGFPAKLGIPHGMDVQRAYDNLLRTIKAAEKNCMILATGNWRVMPEKWTALNLLFDKHRGDGLRINPIMIDGHTVTLDLFSGHDEALYGSLCIINCDRDSNKDPNLTVSLNAWRGKESFIEIGFGSAQVTIIEDVLKAFAFCQLQRGVVSGAPAVRHGSQDSDDEKLDGYVNPRMHGADDFVIDIQNRELKQQIKELQESMARTDRLLKDNRISDTELNEIMLIPGEEDIKLKNIAKQSLKNIRCKRAEHNRGRNSSTQRKIVIEYKNRARNEIRQIRFNNDEWVEAKDIASIQYELGDGSWKDKGIHLRIFKKNKLDSEARMTSQSQFDEPLMKHEEPVTNIFFNHKRYDAKQRTRSMYLLEELHKKLDFSKMVVSQHKQQQPSLQQRETVNFFEDDNYSTESMIGKPLPINKDALARAIRELGQEPAGHRRMAQLLDQDPRRMAQREFSTRRDSPVMTRLLEEIIAAQDK